MSGRISKCRKLVFRQLYPLSVARKARYFCAIDVDCSSWSQVILSKYSQLRWSITNTFRRTIGVWSYVNFKVSATKHEIVLLYI